MTYTSKEIRARTTELLADVRAFRRARWLSQSEFAAMAGVSVRALQTHELGERRPGKMAVKLYTELLDRWKTVPAPKSVGEMCREFRAERQMSKRKLSKLTGLADRHIDYLESRPRVRVREKTLARLLAVLRAA